MRTWEDKVQLYFRELLCGLNQSDSGCGSLVEPS
jgi:hypothetical protein